MLPGIGDIFEGFQRAGKCIPLFGVGVHVAPSGEGPRLLARCTVWRGVWVHRKCKQGSGLSKSILGRGCIHSSSQVRPGLQRCFLSLPQLHLGRWDMAGGSGSLGNGSLGVYYYPCPLPVSLYANVVGHEVSSSPSPHTSATMMLYSSKWILTTMSWLLETRDKTPSLKTFSLLLVTLWPSPATGQTPPF